MFHAKCLWFIITSNFLTSAFNYLLHIGIKFKSIYTAYITVISGSFSLQSLDVQNTLIKTPSLLMLRNRHPNLGMGLRNTLRRVNCLIQKIQGYRTCDSLHFCACSERQSRVATGTTQMNTTVYLN